MKFDPANELPSGTRLGKYEIVRVIGAGGMGAVYEAIHLDLKKRVAVKTLHPELAQKSLPRQRFLREGEAASRIRHPNVVDVTDVGTEKNMPYLVMEYLDGLDLKAHLIQNGAMSVAEAIDLMLPITAAVATGHDEGVIHRDLKPQNIFLARPKTGEMLPKVLDFGVSKLMDAQPNGTSLTGTTAVMGTIAYMSPEQAKGAKFVDARTDQYSLGLILYECVTGVRAFRGENTLAVLRAIGDGQVQAPRMSNGSVPEELEAIILKSMSLKPADRFASLYSFGRAMLPYASERGKSMWSSTYEREPSPASLQASFVIEDVPGDDGGAPMAMKRQSNPELPVPVVRRLTSTGTVSLKKGSGLEGHGGSTMGAATGELFTTGSPRRTSRAGLWIGVGAIAIIGVVGGVLMMRSGNESSSAAANPPPAASVRRPAPAPIARPATYRISILVQPPEAEITLDGQPAGNSSLTRDLPADTARHELKVSAPDFETMTVAFTKDTLPPASITLVPQARAPQPAPAVAAKHKPAAATGKTGPSAPAPGHRVGANQAPIIKD